MSCGSGSCGGCGGCKVLCGIVALLLTLTTIAAALGVYHAHLGPDGTWMFGTLAGSVSLFTFIVSMVAWLKIVKKMCPCGSKGGMCPGCGQSPCKC